MVDYDQYRVEDDHDSSNPTEIQAEQKDQEDHEPAVPPELQGANRQLLLDLLEKQGAAEGKGKKVVLTSTKGEPAPKKKAAPKFRKAENIKYASSASCLTQFSRHSLISWFPQIKGREEVQNGKPRWKEVLPLLYLVEEADEGTEGGKCLHCLLLAVAFN